MSEELSRYKTMGHSQAYGNLSVCHLKPFKFKLTYFIQINKIINFLIITKKSMQLFSARPNYFHTSGIYRSTKIVFSRLSS